MAKDNIFLGLGRGKLGDLVLYRAGGQQVTRTRNRNPKNPRTPLQLLQRVILHTASSAYSIFQPLSDHAFQGYSKGTPCQSRFTAINVKAMRDQVAAAAAAAGVDISDAEFLLESELTNYAYKYIAGAVFREWIISDGTLPVLQCNTVGNHTAVMLSGDIGDITMATMTYADLARLLGLAIGDQVTFVWLYSNFSSSTTDFIITDMMYSRIILQPDSGDPAETLVWLQVAGGTNYNVANANPANEGNLYASLLQASGTITVPRLNVYPTPGTETALDSHYLVGIAAIASRRVGNQWLRSRAQVALMPVSGVPYDYNEYELGTAIQSYMTSQQSSLYLNQATGF